MGKGLKGGAQTCGRVLPAAQPTPPRSHASALGRPQHTRVPLALP